MCKGLNVLKQCSVIASNSDFSSQGVQTTLESLKHCDTRMVFMGEGEGSSSLDEITNCRCDLFSFQRWVSEKFIVEGLREFELFGGKSLGDVVRNVLY